MKINKYASVTAATLCLATSANAAMISYWSFNSDFTADAGGTAFDLTATNGASAGDAGGKFGNAATFERANSEYAVTTGNVLTANSDFSYSAWYNISVADITGSNRYFVLETSAANGISNASAWTASIGLRESGGDVVQIYTHPSVAVGDTGSTASAWNNIVVTYDSGATTMTAYLNGTQFGQNTGIASTTAVEGLVIGGHRNGTGRNFDGQIDDVAFFDTVLTPNEISFLQNNPAASIPEPSAALLVGLAGLAMVLRRRK